MLEESITSYQPTLTSQYTDKDKPLQKIIWQIFYNFFLVVS